MNPDAYLKRIKFTGQPRVDLATLRKLVLAHLYTVPFENHSIHTGERIRLEESWLFDKIVTRRRGGFCYECNGLFHWLLTTLGFNVTLLAGQVWNGEKETWGAAFDHLVLRVDLDEPYLVDVGFGDCFRSPLRLEDRNEQTDDWGQYQLREDGDDLVYWRFNQKNSAWEPQYQLSLIPRDFSDFKKMCHYHQTSWQSPFTRKPIATLATPMGRLTLSDDRLIETTGEKRAEQILMGVDVIDMVLVEYFGIVLIEEK